jgi:hypothetical protein
MKVVAVLLVRDEQDIVATTIRYHRARGVDEVLVVDNGSTDRTVAILERMHRRDPAVRWTSEPGEYRQAEIVTGMAREAVARGADWVLPVDADEFWWSAEPLRDVLERHGRDAGLGALHCEVVNFAQERGVHRRRTRAGTCAASWRSRPTAASTPSGPPARWPTAPWTSPASAIRRWPMTVWSGRCTCTSGAWVSAAAWPAGPAGWRPRRHLSAG